MSLLYVLGNPTIPTTRKYINMQKINTLMHIRKLTRTLKTDCLACAILGLPAHVCCHSPRETARSCSQPHLAVRSSLSSLPGVRVWV